MCPAGVGEVPCQLTGIDLSFQVGPENQTPIVGLALLGPLLKATTQALMFHFLKISPLERWPPAVLP